MQDQIETIRERVRQLGISLLGEDNGIQGTYKLEIDSTRAVNQEDVTLPSEYIITMHICHRSHRPCFQVRNVRMVLGGRDTPYKRRMFIYSRLPHNAYILRGTIGVCVMMEYGFGESAYVTLNISISVHFDYGR